MKRNNYKLCLAFFAFMIAMITIGSLKTHDEIVKNREKLEISYYESREMCNSFNGLYETDDQKHFCELSKEEYIGDGFSFQEIFMRINEHMPLPLFSFLTIFLIALCSCTYVCKYLKTNLIQCDLTRTKYAHIKNKMFLDALMPSIILPSLIIIVGIISYLYAGSLIIASNDTSSNDFLYCLAAIAKSFLVGVIYCNICLIVTRKQHNFILASIMSFLGIIGLEIFLEVIVGSLICYHIFGSGIGIIFNILDCIVFYKYGLAVSLAVPFVIVIVTALIISYMYKDKESLVIDCEANDGE